MENALHLLYDNYLNIISLKKCKNLHKILTFFGKMIKYKLNLFGRFINMIRLINEIIIDYSKNSSVRNKYCANTTCSRSNKISNSKSVSIKAL